MCAGDCATHTGPIRKCIGPYSNAWNSRAFKWGTKMRPQGSSQEVCEQIEGDGKMLKVAGFVKPVPVYDMKTGRLKGHAEADSHAAARKASDSSSPLAAEFDQFLKQHANFVGEWGRTKRSYNFA